MRTLMIAAAAAGVLLVAPAFAQSATAASMQTEAAQLRRLRPHRTFRLAVTDTTATTAGGIGTTAGLAAIITAGLGITAITTRRRMIFRHRPLRKKRPFFMMPRTSLMRASSGWFTPRTGVFEPT